MFDNLTIFYIISLQYIIFTTLDKGPYKPNKHEPNILKPWLKNNFYKSEYDPKQDKLLTLEELKQDKTPTFCIVNPPPTANGRPHLGNVSGYAYQDFFLRFWRMQGKKVLGLPGKDHAGIQGKLVITREYLAPEGLGKHNLSNL